MATDKILIMKTFQDDKGNTSSTRIKTFIAAMVAFGLAIIIVLTKEKIDPNGIVFVTMLLSYSAGEKSYQKYIEYLETQKPKEDE